MATYYVDGKNGNDGSGNGNSNNPWKTIKKAVQQVSPGDTVKLRTATYKEDLRITKDNTTWQADDGHQPVLDGGYNESLMTGDGMPGPDEYIPGGKWAYMVVIRGNNTVVDGLTIQNIGGRGVVVVGNRSTLRNCRIDFCYGAGIVVSGDPRVASALIENNTVTRCSMKLYHKDRDQDGVESVDGTCQLVRADAPIVRHNIIAYNFGEGIGIARGTEDALVEGNVVHTNYHVHLYMTKSRGAVVRNNFVYHIGLREYVGDLITRLQHGIVMGDEVNNDYGFSGRNIVYNNIVVNMGKNFEVRNDRNKYNTQLSNSYVGYNTFVSGNNTRVNVHVRENLMGRPHEKSIFENNVILQLPGTGEISQVNGNPDGIAFRNNTWSEAPVAQMRGPNDQIGDPRLANPEAKLEGTPPGPANGDPFNYRLTKASSLAIGQSSDGRPVNGMTPPTIERDFFNGNRDNAPDIGAHEYAGEAAQISANFTIGPGQIQGQVPHTVDFVDKSTSTAPIVAWAWDFGDGGKSTETNPVHTFMQPGSFTVGLKITDENGLEDSIVQPGLVVALPDVPDVVAEDFRRFIVLKEPTETILAFGTQYPDLNCVLLWNDEPFHILNYATIEDIIRQFEASGDVTLLWLDPAREAVEAGEPVSTDDYRVAEV